jgi:rhodanese-related sulfurtransferase
MDRRKRMLLWALAVWLAAPGPLAAADARPVALAADTAFAEAAEGALTVVDIRTPQEWRQTGIPRGATAVTLHDPQGPAGFLRKILALVDGDKGRPIALLCTSGSRSAWAAALLQRQGFAAVYNVAEGMLGNGRAPGWLRRGLPVERCTAC